MSLWLAHMRVQLATVRLGLARPGNATRVLLMISVA